MAQETITFEDLQNFVCRVLDEVESALAQVFQRGLCDGETCLFMFQS